MFIRDWLDIDVFFKSWFSRTPSEAGVNSVSPGADSAEILRESGLDEAAIAQLFEQGVVQ